MALRQRFLAGFAAQLGRPSGVAGQLVGRMLNRVNSAAVSGAVAAVEARPGETVADVGFGGGAGLRLLLHRVGASGHVHGVEVSTTMLSEARRRFRRELDAGRLELHDAPMTRMPLPDASLDAVISTNTVYFVDDLTAACAELARVLRPSGRLALGIGDPDAMATKPFTGHGFTLRPVEEITAALTTAGLTLTEHRRIGQGLVPFHVLLCTRTAD